MEQQTNAYCISKIARVREFTNHHIYSRGFLLEDGTTFIISSGANLFSELLMAEVGDKIKYYFSKDILNNHLYVSVHEVLFAELPAVSLLKK